MDLKEAEKIVRKMTAFLDDGYDENTLVIDGSLTKEELQALWIVVEAKGIQFRLED